ncbi:PucR family transcriptional regulator [Mycobacterium vicinigordonae]|uniref:PucR family transcriptional regulator n=1 Tax=Mycobacterium vicinigordonae TaxID=1719132 RepID=UPI001FE3A7E7|nr:helix-turn-helix domain-containing protein [Mycobacterium vicinigordonae]
MPHADLVGAVKKQDTFILESLGTGHPDTRPASLVGRRRAEQGVPLPDVMSAYRVGLEYLWEKTAEAVAEAQLSLAELQLAGSEIWRSQAEYTEAMSEAYREAATEQLLRQREERSALVTGLLEGRLPGDVTAWDAVRLLGLPESGFFTVAAIKSATLDSRPLRAIEQVLSADGFASAWRLDPDMQIGIIALSAPTDAEQLARSLEKHSLGRIGVSPIYDGHPPPGAALNYAKAALRAATADEPLIVFDAHPYAVAAITDPQTMTLYRDLVLAGLNAIDNSDRRILVSTFRAWVDSGGSVSQTATRMHCHPNTVRYRLGRLKDHTGYDVSVPRDLAQLHLAIEADHRLGPAAGAAQAVQTPR